MNARNWGLLLFLSLLWGSSFFFYKVLVAVLPPVTVVLGRVGFAAIALNLWLAVRGTPLSLGGGLWKRFLLLGLLNNAIPFVLIAWGETHITSGMASILNATTPIFMVVVAHLGTHDEKLSAAKVLGIAFGIVGTVVLVGPAAFAGTSYIWGELAVIAASCTYAFAGVYSRRFTGLAPLTAATGQITGAAAILLPLSLLVDRSWHYAVPDVRIWAAWLAIALVNTALAYVVYYRMLATAGVTAISLTTFIIPPIAVVLGAAVLAEPVTWNAIAGMGIIALGILAIDGRFMRRRTVAAA
ncbi:MAG: DMT family transporter [Alphaproteobacteria bacterium]|nr:DMT family transporter [Alphaproteobacteria bacterium]